MVQAQYLMEQQRIYAALAICSGANLIFKCKDYEPLKGDFDQSISLQDFFGYVRWAF
jgi:hypothetical protein